MIEQIRFLSQELRAQRPAGLRAAFYMLFDLGVWAVVLYRLSRALFLVPVPGLRIVTRLLGYLLHKVCELVLRVSVPPGTEIGPGFYVAHGGPIYIHHEVRCGANLRVGPGVLIGQRGMGALGVPTLGDDVYVGVGAKILGKVSVGSNVRIGANSVIVNDVPNSVIVFGVPARVVGPVFGAKRKSPPAAP